MIPEDDIDQAIGRLALTPDGRMLYLRLQRVLMTLAPPSGALPEHEGKRRFAHELKVLMDRKLAEQPSGRTDADRPIVIASPRAVSSARPRGTERRVPAVPESGNAADEAG